MIIERGTEQVRAGRSVTASTLACAACAIALAAATVSSTLLEPSTLGLRARHSTHVTVKGIACTACHEEASSSGKASDLLLPSSETCRQCHPEAVCAGAETPVCATCHKGKPRSLLSARFAHAAKTTMKFPHAKHVAIAEGDCLTCHALDAGNPDGRNPTLPGMQSCLACHPHGPTFDEDFCTPCHSTTKKGTITPDPGGNKLLPPAWMHGAKHGGAWVLEHSAAAANRPRFCAACHTDGQCASCHAGKVKPASIHPGDWLSFHPVSAALGDLRCSACHSYQNFCLTCHRKAGVAWDSPSGLGVPAGDVFHPSGWYSLGGGPNLHGKQAKKNLTSCVACHAELDCMTCHSPASTFSVSPHPAPSVWLDKCDTLAAKNPAACLKCHTSVPTACQ